MGRYIDSLRLAVTALGVVLVGAGAWMIYPPAGLIASGALLIAGGIIGHLRSGR